MKKKCALFLLLLCPFLGHGQKDSVKTAAPANGIAVFPATLSFDLDRGGTRTQIVNVRNSTQTPYQLELSLMDWTRDTLGDHTFTDAGGMEQSCAKWISLDKSFIELKPGEATTVAVTMKVPDNASAVSEMKWTMLLLKTVTEKFAPVPNVKLAISMVQSLAVGVHIYQTPPNVTNKEIKMLNFSEMPGRTTTYRITSKNVGGVQLACKFSLELTAEQTGVKTSLTSKIIPLFPNQDRYVDFTLPDSLPKGKYTIIAMIDADDDSVPIEAVQKEIVIK